MDPKSSEAAAQERESRPPHVAQLWNATKAVHVCAQTSRRIGLPGDDRRRHRESTDLDAAVDNRQTQTIKGGATNQTTPDFAH